MADAAKNNKWLGYSLYIVLVGLLLLYYLFPAQAVEDLIDSSVSRVHPSFGFKAEKIRPWLPPGLRISNGTVYLGESTGPAVFKADRLYVKPSILKLFSGKYSLQLSGTAYRSDIKGSLHLDAEKGATLESELFFENLDLGAYEILTEKLQHRLTGMFSGSVFYTRGSANTSGNGKADLRLTAGQLVFENPVFGISSVDLQNIDLEMELRNRNITIIKGGMTGPEMNGSLAGSIQLQPDVKNSQLNLKGTLEPLAEFYRKYPEIRELLKTMNKRVKRGQYFFTITGTLSQPRFRML